MDSDKQNESPSMFVALHKLCVGDVLLFGGNTISSQAIKAVTKSKYSHAAIYTGRGHYLDSTKDSGVAVRRFPVVHVQSEAAQYIGSISGVTDVSVFRHASIPDECASWVYGVDESKKMQAACIEAAGLYYSKLERLAEVHEVGAISGAFGRLFLKLLDGEVRAEGVFCSELVSIVLEKYIGEEVIPGLASKETSPAAFAQYAKSFRLVDAVLTKLPEYQMTAAEFEAIERIKGLSLVEDFERLVNVRQTNELLIESLEKIKAQLQP